MSGIVLNILYKHIPTNFTIYSTISPWTLALVTFISINTCTTIHTWIWCTVINIAWNNNMLNGIITVVFELNSHLYLFWKVVRYLTKPNFSRTKVVECIMIQQNFTKTLVKIILDINNVQNKLYYTRKQKLKLQPSQWCLQVKANIHIDACIMTLIIL
jgi:hypothetical protein